MIEKIINKTKSLVIKYFFRNSFTRKEETNFQASNDRLSQASPLSEQSIKSAFVQLMVKRSPKLRDKLFSELRIVLSKRFYG